MYLKKVSAHSLAGTGETFKQYAILRIFVQTQMAIYNYPCNKAPLQEGAFNKTKLTHLSPAVN